MEVLPYILIFFDNIDTDGRLSSYIPSACTYEDDGVNRGFQFFPLLRTFCTFIYLYFLYLCLSSPPYFLGGIFFSFLYIYAHYHLCYKPLFAPFFKAFAYFFKYVVLVHGHTIRALS